MPSGEFSIICFRFLSDFWRKSQKGAKRKTRQKRAPSPQRGTPSPWRNPKLQRGLPRHGEDKGPKRPPPPPPPPPRLHCSVDLLRRSEVLRRSVAMPRRGVDTVHRGKNFGFLFQKSRIRTLIV